MKLDIFKLKYIIQSKFHGFVLQDTIAPNDYLGMDANNHKILWSVKSLSYKDCNTEEELAFIMMKYGNMVTIFSHSDDEQKIRFAAHHVKVELNG